MAECRYIVLDTTKPEITSWPSLKGKPYTPKRWRKFQLKATEILNAGYWGVGESIGFQQFLERLVYDG